MNDSTATRRNHLEKHVDNGKVATAFNLWMDEFTNDPEAFESTTATALKHLRERSEGREPSYGEKCAVLLDTYMAKAA